MSLHVPNDKRIRDGRFASDESIGNNGAFRLRTGMMIIASDGGGWEHVSCSFHNRTPTWDEMCEVKAMFWDDEDTVVQYHPAKSEYVNIHQHCLHLWRLIGVPFPEPPSMMVGPKVSP